MTENKRFNKVEVYLSYEIFDNKANEQLDVNKTVDLMNQLNDENEQLKQFNEKVLKLLDEKIKEYKKYDGYDTESYYIGTGLLKELKRELEE